MQVPIIPPANPSDVEDVEVTSPLFKQYSSSVFCSLIPTIPPILVVFPVAVIEPEFLHLFIVPLPKFAAIPPALASEFIQFEVTDLVFWQFVISPLLCAVIPPARADQFSFVFETDISPRFPHLKTTAFSLI